MLDPIRPPLLDAIDRLRHVGRPRSYARNEIVYHEGDEGTSLYVTTAGRFAKEMTSPEGHVLLLTVLQAEDLFGDISILSSEPYRRATVVALEPSQASVVSRQDFDRVRAEDPYITEFVTNLLAARLRWAVERITELAHLPAPRRVLRVLDRLAKIYDVGADETVVTFTQQRVAAMAGTSRDTVNRVLAQAEQEGWLKNKREKIVVLDARELARRAQ